MTLVPAIAALLFAANPSPLDTARDRQDPATLGKLLDAAARSAEKAPNDAQAQYQAALAASCLAAVHVELHDRKSARAAAERGIVFGERAVSLKPDIGEYYRVLGALYGQAVTDLISGLRYGPKARDAISKAVEKSPHSSNVYVARGVGNLYLPSQLGGGAGAAIPDFRKAIEIDPQNAEAWVYLGVALRMDKKEDDARRAFNKALELNPNRFWVRQLLVKSPEK
jgi:tetratricopeptide (TPR) repeat protein